MRVDGNNLPEEVFQQELLLLIVLFCPNLFENCLIICQHWLIMCQHCVIYGFCDNFLVKIGIYLIGLKIDR